MQAQQNCNNSNPLTEDLDYILSHTNNLWEEIRGKQLFITGGTGFFGLWLLESFVRANDNLALNATAVVLTRDYDAFKRKAPHLAVNPAIRFHIGDIMNFDFPEGEFSHIIHAAATSAIATFNNEDLLVKFDTVVEGTRRALNFAVKCSAMKFLLTSSGSMYGRQQPGMTHISEDYCGAPDPADPNSAWGEGKRAAEFLCAYYSRKYGIETKIARCFSFVGPYLQLDIHYAVGNFIRDAVAGQPIRINGDGTPFRSYLYAADLAIWLWTILFKGESGKAYNVGSEDEITISELADMVSSFFDPPSEIRLAFVPSLNKHADRYVPSTALARRELGLMQRINLQEALRKTIKHTQHQLQFSEKKTDEGK